MKKFIYLILAGLPLFLTSCATPSREAFHNTDSTALVLKSLDSQTCQMLQPTVSAPAANQLVLSKAQSLPQHQTVVVMLENYHENHLGEQFEDRTRMLFLDLRSLGYEHIIFVQGQNMSDPNGLITLAEYH